MPNIKKEQFNPNIIMHTEYDLLITYDDWEIFKFQDKNIFEAFYPTFYYKCAM